MKKNLHLLPGEKIVNIHMVDDTKPTLYMDPLEALARLCAVSDPTLIGANGPINASASCGDSEDMALKKYETLFGRDALYVSLILADLYPELLRSTVRRLAELQGTEHRRYAEEEPGRIIHEYRTPDDKIRKSNTSWLWPYYGAVDPTPVFVLACQKVHTQDKNFLKETTVIRGGKVLTLEEACVDALRWTMEKLDRSEVYFIESQPSFKASIDNQTWKDSFDSMSFANGELPDTPLSSVEVQAFAYDALKFGSEYFRGSKLGYECRKSAKKLGQQFEKYYINKTDVGPKIAMGVGINSQGEAASLWTLGSNIGHLLNSSLLDDLGRSDIQEWIIKALFSEELLGAAGVRTLGKSEKRYRPGSYHCGQVWLWESAFFALYLAELGYVEKAQILKEKVLKTCDEFGGFPEFARGDQNEISFNMHVVDIVDAAGRANRIEQPPQQIQGWTVAGVVALQMSKLIPTDVVITA